MGIISTQRLTRASPGVPPSRREPQRRRAHMTPRHSQTRSLLCKMHDNTLGAMSPPLMLLLLLLLPVLIKLGNPLSRQKRGAPRFIIKEEGDAAANTAPVNETHNPVLQDVEISITWQSAPTPTPHPTVEGWYSGTPPPLPTPPPCFSLVLQSGGAV